MKFPRVLASAVIRTAHEGESHGGLYLVDLDAGDARQVINWDSRNISFRDRGGERGLRGIEFHDSRIYVTSFDKILVYDKDFRKLEEYGNAYLADCHETHARGELLYISSTAFDSVLVFDMKRREFIKGYCLRNDLDRIVKKGIWKAFGIKQCPGAKLRIFDPRGNDGPRRDDVLHLNNVRVQGDRVYLSAYRMKTLYCLENDRLRPVAGIPVNTHNVRPFGAGFLACCTGDNEVVRLNTRGQKIMSFPTVTYADDQLIMNHLPNDFARPAFVRGLCVHGEELVIAGSSPATVTAYNLSTGALEKSINISMDVRNAIHGLEIYPY